MKFIFRITPDIAVVIAIICLQLQINKLQNSIVLLQKDNLKLSNVISDQLNKIK